VPLERRNDYLHNNKWSRPTHLFVVVNIIMQGWKFDGQTPTEDVIQELGYILQPVSSFEPNGDTFLCNDAWN
jgi:hypothetical protein